jgi:putative FmdB family regulatory protein
MPTYEYKCDACGNEFEKFQPMSAEPIKKCPSCGKNKARRLISAGAGLIFKGSGFYITDYRDKGYTDKAKADSGTAEKPAETKSADPAKPAASESKPAETKAEKPAGEKSPSEKPSGKSKSKSMGDAAKKSV